MCVCSFMRMFDMAEQSAAGTLHADQSAVVEALEPFILENPATP